MTHSISSTLPTTQSLPSEGQDDAVFSRLSELPQLLLTSGQTLPNLLAMHELRASGYVLLCTPEERPERLRGICASLGYNELDEPIVIDALDDRRTEKAVREGFAKLVKKYPDRSWVLNTTGGTKLACLGATRALGSPDANVPGLAGNVYYDKGLHSTVPGWSRVAKRGLTRPLGVGDLLEAHGILRHGRAHPPILGANHTYELAPAPTAEDRAVARAIASDPESQTRIGGQRQGSLIPKAGAEVLARRYVHGSKGSGYLAQSASNFFNGIWLECFLYDVLVRHRDEGRFTADDIQMGVKLKRIPAAGSATAEEETDLDVCWASENLFSFVSCKSGSVEDLSDEVFEVEVRRKSAGGTFGAGGLLHVHESGRLGNDKKKKLRRTGKLATALGVVLLGGELLRDEAALLTRLTLMRRR